MYVFFLLGILHMISDMLIKWPSKHIMIGKTDLGATYRRFHANAQIAATYIAIVVKLAFLCICLPFGTTLTSAVYTTISEAEIDFENNLLTDTSWDATNLQSLHQQLIPREDYLPASDPLVKAYHIAVDIKAKEVSMDGFIYEIITITIDDPRWVESANNAALFIVHTIFRPWHSNKPLKLYYLLSLRKLVGEGQPAKCKTCLVWDIHTCYLRVFLLRENEKAWVHDIRESPALTKINTDKQESLIGKLNHADHIITPESYFLNRLHNILKIGKKWGPQRLQSWHIQDLQLWIKILQWVAETEVPINNIVSTTPTVTLWSDAYEYRIRGYNYKGISWCCYIPPEWHGLLTLNLLEFLTSAVSIYMTIQKMVHKYHVLAFTDSYSSLR